MPAQRMALIELRNMAESAAADDDEQFVKVMQQGKDTLQLSVGEIAGALLVSRLTVIRWLTAQSRPHPALRPSIFTWIARQAQSWIDKIDVERS